ncbi:hypothetical protein ACFWUW_04320 [Streptomyces sp. NPDC058655]|uniref:hypothetical protein n=1 Tax=Streptomyces sp. NPDC058655 TaxID=3346577 RepID=UPI0036688EDF
MDFQIMMRRYGPTVQICLDAHTRLNVDPETVGKIIRRSLYLDSKLGRKTIDALLDMALPPSAKPSQS